MKNKKNSVYDGAENTFILSSGAPTEAQKSPIWIQSECKKNNVDGILFLESIQNKFKWHFFNSDGSTAEMCGNAARCATQFLHEEENIKTPIDFLTQAGPVQGLIKENKYCVVMPSVNVINSKMDFPEIAPKEILFFVNTGVPHLVWDLSQKTNQLFEDKKNWLATIRQLRKANTLGPGGANVTLVTLSSGGKKAVTFERGVEDFTQACGTGAVAAAIYFQMIDHKTRQEIDMPGGKLEIALDLPTPILSGPTKKIRTIQWDGV